MFEKHSIVIFSQIKRDYLVIFFANIAAHFCVFCLFRRIPFKYGGSGRLLWPFFDGFQKPIKI